MTHPLRTLERQLDRLALELAFSYERLLDRTLDDAQARRELDPTGTYAASVVARAEALRELVRHIAAPATTRLEAVWVVVPAMSVKPAGAFSTREAAEEWLRRQGRAACGFALSELPVEPPHTTRIEEFAHKLELGREVVADVERELGPLPERLLREVDEQWLEADADIRPPDGTGVDGAPEPDDDA
jgi:hypothetical protein